MYTPIYKINKRLNILEIENYENIQLIIFDCDGVLIDSEIISAKVISMQFNKLGIEYKKMCCNK